MVSSRASLTAAEWWLSFPLHCEGLPCYFLFPDFRIMSSIRFCLSVEAWLAGLRDRFPIPFRHILV